jgi:hypothetical protein
VHRHDRDSARIPSDSQTAGASQSAYFTASGSTAEPTGCIFNSQVCTG